MANDRSVSLDNRPGVVRILTALVLFGVSFGYVEAAVVTDLRAVYDPIHRHHHPDVDDGSLFPILTLEQLRAAGGRPLRLLGIEMVREAATILMLAGVALAATRRSSTWLAAFVLVFGLWDICFYVFLKVLIDWPGSLLEWDLLFLLPVPWAGPVLAPVGVAAVMIVAGSVVLVEAESGRPTAHRRGDWAAIFLGGLVLIVAFCWDWRNILAGGTPNPFRWDLYALGLAIGLAGFVHGLLMPRESKSALAMTGDA